MKIKYLKSGFVFIVGVFLLLGIQTQPTAQQVDPNNPGQGQSKVPNNNGKPAKAKYAPGRFIVKFKSEGPNAVTGDAQSLLESSQPFQAAVSDASDSLDTLNKKHNIQRARSLFIERHGLPTADARQKQNNNRQSSQAMHQSRNQRAPKDAVIPDLSNIYVLEVAPESNIETIVQEYQADPHVEYAQPDYLMETNMVPNDPYYSSSGSWGQTYDDLWGLKNIQAEQAWDITQGEGVIVAVVDTGLDYNHPDIAANVWTNPGEIPNNSIDDDGNGYIDDIRGWDFIGSDGYNPTPDNDSMDGNGHGTHVSGTIAAIGNNSIGVIGVAPQAKIMPVKGLDDQGGGWDSTLSMALIYAADQGADVINNSWGGMGASQLIEDAVNYAYSKGCVVVAAAGNDNADVSSYYPAALSNVITVAASDQNDIRSDFSNFGAKIDVSAPGGGSGPPDQNNILSLLSLNHQADFNPYIVGTNYLRLAGTSMACPHVSGLVALTLSNRPNLSNEDVRMVLRTSADDIGLPGFDIRTGNGRINAYTALQIDSVCYAKITNPVGGLRITQPVTLEIQGTAAGANFQSYKLEYSDSQSGNWTPIGQISYTPVTQGTLGTWKVPTDLRGSYFLRLTVTDNYGRVFRDAVGALTISMDTYHPGWPYRTSQFSPNMSLFSSPLIVDLENDGEKELIIFTPDDDNKIYVLNEQGVSKPGWPVMVSALGDIGNGSPTVADLDKDGNLEIIVHDIDKVYVYDKNGHLLPGWPVIVESNVITYGRIPAPVVADINQDGNLDVVIMHSNKTLHVLQKDGTYLPGWPITRYKDWQAVIQSTPAVADLDGDGYPEIVCVLNNYMVVFNYDGKIKVGWPKKLSVTSGFTGSPVLGDFDLDNDLEIAVPGVYNNGSYGVVNIFHHNGQIMQGWPKSLGGRIQPTGLSLADINKDGRLEVIIAASQLDLRGIELKATVVFAFRDNGQLIWKSENINIPCLEPVVPIIADINGDTSLEIIVASGQLDQMTGEINVFDNNGNRINDLSKYYPESFFTSPAVSDFDNDGKLELAAATARGTILVWDMDGEDVQGNTPWPVFQHDPQRSGRYGVSSPGGSILRKATRPTTP